MDGKVVDYFSPRGGMFRIRAEEGSTDKIVIREAFEENTYNLHPDDFRHTGVFVDIGANIGAVSALARQLGARKVVAYEPVPDNFDLLAQNMAIHQVPADIAQKAVWSSRGSLKIISAQGASSSNPQALASGAPVLEVETVTLADVLAPYADVDVLKCDTEGAEYEILLDPEVNKKARKIVVEYHTTTIDKIGALLATLSLTHNIRAFGHWRDRGGQIEALRY